MLLLVGWGELVRKERCFMYCDFGVLLVGLLGDDGLDGLGKGMVGCKVYLV